MKEITLAEFPEHLRRYGTGVHCGSYANGYTVCCFKTETDKFYYDRGCAVFSSEWDDGGKHYINVNIHQAAPDASIDEVKAYWPGWAEEHANSYDSSVIWVFLYVISNGELPPEKDKYDGWRNFVRQGFRVEPDSRVRRLTET